MLVFRKYAKTMTYLFQVMTRLNMKVFTLDGTTYFIHSFSCNRVGNRWRLEFVAEPYEGIPVVDILGHVMHYYVYEYATPQDRQSMGSPVFETQVEREIPWLTKVPALPLS